MLDADFDLREQFCLVRTFAMEQSDALTARSAGLAPDQIAEQCAAFGLVMQEHVAALSLKPAAEGLGGALAVPDLFQLLDGLPQPDVPRVRIPLFIVRDCR